MNEDRDKEEDPILDLWIRNWEEQCVQELEREPDYTSQLQSERDLSSQKVWILFQNAATAVAQLYKDRLQGVSLWVPFQSAAGSVTSLYKESSDIVRRVSDMSIQCGYQRRSREILNWARKKRRHIKREDLIAYLAGKNPPPRSHHHRGSQRSRMVFERAQFCHGGPNHSQVHEHSNSGASNIDETLHTFREALAFSASAVGMNRRRSSPHHVAELSAFMSNEFTRHCKRPAPSSPTHDVNMDSPTHKRSRLN